MVKKTNRKKRQKQAYCVMQDVNHQLFSDSVSGECLLSNHGYTGQQIKQILEHFDLLPFEEIHPMALSGGQKQRLAITTAILSRKQLLIFDEPTSGLDYVHMIKVAKAIKELANKGSTVIVVTHDKEFIRHVCDRILVL
jgi:energy-coupling factor transport system ATP-binding protein